MVIIGLLLVVIIALVMVNPTPARLHPADLGLPNKLLSDSHSSTDVKSEISSRTDSRQGREAWNSDNASGQGANREQTSLV